MATYHFAKEGETKDCVSIFIILRLKDNNCRNGADYIKIPSENVITRKNP